MLWDKAEHCSKYCRELYVQNFNQHFSYIRKFSICGFSISFFLYRSYALNLCIYLSSSSRRWLHWFSVFLLGHDAIPLVTHRLILDYSCYTNPGNFRAMNLNAEVIPSWFNLYWEYVLYVGSFYFGWGSLHVILIWFHK